MIPLVIDCTELYQNPVRTGIQRVVREMLGHWPYDRINARIARFDPVRGLVPLSERAVRILADEEPGVAAMSCDALIESLRSADTKADPLPSDHRVFIPEVFYDHARCRFYEGRAPAMLAYDFLPWLRPGLFASPSSVGLMPYLRLLSKVPQVAFISEQTKREYEIRIARRPAAGPVLPLGADGLAVERQTWRSDRRSIVCLGSVDGRKNQHVVAAGFMSLWRAGIDAPLVLIGRAFEGVDRGCFAEAEASAQFRWLEDASDADIAHELRQARATIYASTSEGFGLPPIESLGIGIPVIASAVIPSLEMLSRHGQLRLAEITPACIAEAVAAIMEDTTAERLWAEAASLELGSWRAFAERSAEWVAGFAAGTMTRRSGDPPIRNTALVPLRSLADVAEINALFDNEIDRIPALTNSYLELSRGHNAMSALDPFSDTYFAAAKGWLEEITGRANYVPARDELAEYMVHREEGDQSPVTPSIYALGDSAFLGDMMQAFGAVLIALKVSRGQSVLEYGAGDGQISLALARMGCEVTVVDIEKRYLSQIKAQAAQFGAAVTTIEGAFGTAERGRQYDRILFFESFHHALSHHALLLLLRQQLAPGGSILFAGEPILAVDNYFRCTLPYPWGPRLDGLSLRAMQANGWCELGFTREYFIELLMRTGFVITFIDNPSTSRGAAYKAEAAGAEVALGGPFMIEAVGMPDCWHPGEGEQRFMRAPMAGIPINGASGWGAVSIEIRNHLPLPSPLMLSLGDVRFDTRLAVGESRVYNLPVPAKGGVLTLTSHVHRPCDLSPASKDDRLLGLAVGRMQYHRAVPA